MGCLETDLASAARVVAVKEAEHRAYVLQKFPHFADRITYWHVHDLDMALPEDAIFQLEQHIMQLLDELAGEKTEASGRQSGRFSPG